MYFRIKKSKSGSVLQLLEAYRNHEGKPRHRVVISLGNSSIAQKDWKAIARSVEMRLRNQTPLIPWDHPPVIQEWIDRIIRRIDLQGRWEPFSNQSKTRVPESSEGTINGVIIDKVSHTESAQLGPFLAGLSAWRNLDMDGCLKRLGFNESQRKMAAVTVLNRLVEPLSEHAMVQWLSGTALPELLGDGILRGSRDRYYRISDILLRKKVAIESHIRQAQRRYFSLKQTVFLYDLTNSYFEGTSHKNPKAKRGHSKEKRNDCPLIVVGMVFDQAGFEICHEVFEGNRNDSTTLIEMIETLRSLAKEDDSLFSEVTPTVILDAGIATKANLKLLREKHFNYVVNDSRRGRQVYRDAFLEAVNFEQVKGEPHESDIKVCLIKDPYTDADKDVRVQDTLVLCKSAQRRQKELAMISQAESRLIKSLEKLALRIEKGQIKNKNKIERAIGRIQSKNSRASRFYEVLIENLSSPSKRSPTCRITWKSNEQKQQENTELLGCYVLRTNRDDLTAKELWELYITLTHAEEGFRSLKSDLGLRPNFHRREDRVDAHVFISVLAYQLLQHIMYQLKQKQDVRSWTTIKRILRTHTFTTMILPTETEGVHRIRKAGIPEEMQKTIYSVLGIDWKNLPVKKEYRQPVIPTTL